VVVTAGTRWASRAQFFSSGFIFATWGVHVPTVKAHYGIDEAQLGLALLAAGAGAMLGLTSAGRWIGRHGARRMAAMCGCVYALLLAGLIAMPGYAALLGLLAAFGLVTSVFDVAINTEAAQLELHSGTALMSGMHGMFSLGGMAGAASGSAVLAAGLGAQAHLLLVAALMVLVVAVSSTRMLPRPAATSNAASADHGFRLPRGPLAVLGVLAALGLIAEGAIYDWSVLYMQQELGSPQKQAALAYAAFSAAMAAARFGGDAMRARRRACNRHCGRVGGGLSGIHGRTCGDRPAGAGQLADGRALCGRGLCRRAGRLGPLHEQQQQQGLKGPFGLSAGRALPPAASAPKLRPWQRRISWRASRPRCRGGCSR
jgi:predicted MFS family arabinose efflux permease